MGAHYLLVIIKAPALSFIREFRVWELFLLGFSESCRPPCGDVALLSVASATIFFGEGMASALLGRHIPQN